MAWQVDWRRVAAGGAVLLFHILLVLALLIATHAPVFDRIKQLREIVLTLEAPQIKKEKHPNILEQVPAPVFLKPEALPRSNTEPPPETQRPPEEGDIRALGRYLNNCSGMYYEQLSVLEREHCIGNLWDGEHHRLPTLGPAKPSPFDQVLKERNAPFQAPFQQCDPGSINASLHNVPCTNFSNDHHIMEEVPDH